MELDPTIQASQGSVPKFAGKNAPFNSQKENHDMTYVVRFPAPELAPSVRNNFLKCISQYFLHLFFIKY